MVDHDTVRLKILNEVESAHYMEVEDLNRKINSLKDQILKLRRENELLKHQLETNKLDHQEEVRKIKMWAEEGRRNDHLSELTF